MILLQIFVGVEFLEGIKIYILLYLMDWFIQLFDFEPSKRSGMVNQFLLCEIPLLSINLLSLFCRRLLLG